MNAIDYVIIGLLAFSALAGLLRGFLKELISLLTWIVAAWASWSFAGSIEPHLGGALAEATVRPWAARAILFIGVLLVGAALGAIVGYFVRLSLFSAVDRLLGFLFGTLRGFVALGLLAILCHAVHLQGESWYRESTLVPYVEKLGNVVRVLVGESRLAGF
jgi:membrane protein required for colicin V production